MLEDVEIGGYFEEPPTKRIDMFTDAELLRELSVRKRLKVLSSATEVPGYAMQRYWNETGFRESILKTLCLLSGKELADLSHVTQEGEVNPDPYSRYTDNIQFKMESWIITQPPNRSTNVLR